VHLLPIAAALLALAASPGRAPTPDEVRLYDEGTHALAGGDARGAEKAWRAGYAIGHDPAFLVHIGEAEEKAGAPAEAAESYRQYLREAPDASDRADIEQRLSRLAPAAPAPAPAVEAPGEFGGTPPRPAAAAQAPGAAPHAPRAGHADDDQPSVREEEDSGWNRYNATAVIASGVTLILLGTAAIYGAEASSKESDVNRLINYRFPPTQYSAVRAEYTSAMTDGARDAHNARVVLVAAAATGVVAAAGFVLDAILNPAVLETAPATGPAISLAPLPGGRGAFGAWSWRF
jgi:hypothetical protein